MVASLNILHLSYALGPKVSHNTCRSAEVFTILYCPQVGLVVSEFPGSVLQTFVSPCL